VERTYREVLDDALKDVLQEMVIMIDNNHFIVYIHDISYNGTDISINWSTPHDETEISRQVLFDHLKEAVKIQLKELMERTPIKNTSLFNRIKEKIMKVCQVFSYYC